MAQVVLKCSSNNNGGNDLGIEDNVLIVDNLVNLSTRFGEFCNSLPRTLFQRGYWSGDSGTTQTTTGGSRGMVNKEVFLTYAPQWVEWAKSNYDGYSEETFNAFENVINHIVSTRAGRVVSQASEGIRRWLTIEQRWETVNAGGDQQEGLGKKLASGWRGTDWFAMACDAGSYAPTYGYDEVTRIVNGHLVQKDPEFLNSTLNQFNTGFVRGYTGGFLILLPREYNDYESIQNINDGD